MPTSRPKSDGGFTLIEMLMAITIIGILGTIAAYRLPAAARFGQRPRTAAMVRQILSDTRERALATGHKQEVHASDLSRGTVIAISGSDGTQSLTYYADGSASGGKILLRDRPLVAVDWLTGAVADAR